MEVATARNRSPKERPVLFTAEEVRVTLEGRKSQFRRVVTTQPLRRDEYGYLQYCTDGDPLLVCPPLQIPQDCPYGAPGDRLWCRYPWWHYTPPPTNPANEQAWDEWTRCARWPTGEFVLDCEPDVTERGWRKRSAVHMPRWASRILLEVTEVRVERVQETSEDDALAEGCCPRQSQHDPADGCDCAPSDVFRVLWDARHAKRGFGWDVNPWVWVVGYRRIEP